MKYDYKEEMFNDVKNEIEDRYEKELNQYQRGELSKKDFHEMLYDDFYVDDAVTGNASGSYFFNRQKAEEALTGNFELLGEAAEEFGKECGTLFKKGVEVCDVVIRCHLLYGVIDEVLDEYEVDITDDADDYYGKEDDE